MVNTALENACM